MCVSNYVKPQCPTGVLTISLLWSYDSSRIAEVLSGLFSGWPTWEWLDWSFQLMLIHVSMLQKRASGIALTRELQMAAFAMVLMCNPNIEYWQCFPVYSCCFMCAHPQELECLLAGCECGPIYFSICLWPQDIKEAESQQTPSVVDSSADCSPDCVQGKLCTLMTATCEWLWN